MMLRSIDSRYARPEIISRPARGYWENRPGSPNPNLRFSRRGGTLPAALVDDTVEGPIETLRPDLVAAMNRRRQLHGERQVQRDTPSEMFATGATLSTSVPILGVEDPSHVGSMAIPASWRCPPVSACPAAALTIADGATSNSESLARPTPPLFLEARQCSSTRSRRCSPGPSRPRTRRSGGRTDAPRGCRRPGGPPLALRLCARALHNYSDSSRAASAWSSRRPFAISAICFRKSANRFSMTGRSASAATRVEAVVAKPAEGGSGFSDRTTQTRAVFTCAIRGVPYPVG